MGVVCRAAVANINPHVRPGSVEYLQVLTENLLLDLYFRKPPDGLLVGGGKERGHHGSHTEAKQL